MAGLLQRLRAWWNNDALELAAEETRMTPEERDLADEDYEGRIRDERLQDSPLAGGLGDYESDSEPPRDPAP